MYILRISFFIRRYAQAFIPFFLTLGLWSILAFYINKAGKPFPNPWEVLLNFTGDKAAEIWIHTAYSLIRWITGLIAASLIGVSTGILIGRSEKLYSLSLPFFNMIQLMPGLAWIPIVMLLFGLGTVSTIFIIFITAISPIVLNSASGIRQMNPVYHYASAMMGLSPQKKFFKICLPSAAPQIITGLRTGIGNGWRVLISAEMVLGSAKGLGFTIIQSRWSFDFITSFQAILIIILIGLLTENLLLTPIENRILMKRGLKFSDKF
jgi:ABC-type nitrate/sulfonate/bicarbonate transport system permease component